MLLRTWFLLIYLFSNVKSELIYFIQLVSKHQTFARDFKSSNRNAAGVWKGDKYRNNWVLINASWIRLGSALDLLDIDLLAIDLSDAD